jgi:hypothetical protein
MNKILGWILTEHYMDYEAIRKHCGVGYGGIYD